MAKLKLYSIKDKVAGEFGPIYEAVNDAVAMREFSRIMAKTEFADDFELICMAEMDKVTGQMELCEPYNVVEKELHKEEV